MSSGKAVICAAKIFAKRDAARYRDTYVAQDLSSADCGNRQDANRI
jgi:hypothetical protein